MSVRFPRIQDTPQLAHPEGSACNSSDRQWYVALGFSTTFHVGIIGLLALIWFLIQEPTKTGSTDVISRWALEDELEAAVVLIDSPDISTAETSTSTGSRLFQTSVVETRNLQVNVRQPMLTVTSTLDAMAHADHSMSDLTELVSTDRSEKQQQVGNGDGTNQGGGTGAGTGFFGTSKSGQRVIFVIDCSRSMNHPHNSIAKTRFRRLKLELLKSIGEMDSSMRFYMIFFNEYPIRMPTRSMQPALHDHKIHYLSWMQKLRADGMTEPTEAVRIALKMKPDIIYFLTDGSFTFRVERELLQLKQGKTTIHTFAFEVVTTPSQKVALQLLEAGEFRKARELIDKKQFGATLAVKRSRDLLTRFAARNQGRFHLIP